MALIFGECLLFAGRHKDAVYLSQIQNAADYLFSIDQRWQVLDGAVVDEMVDFALVLVLEVLIIQAEV